MAVNPAALNALTLQWGRQKADIDDQENRYRINYNSALDKLRRNYEQTEGTNRTGFSDRGMLHSGAAIGNQLDLRANYDRTQGETTQALNTNLATLARKRLETDQEFQTQKLLASLGLV